MTIQKYDTEMVSVDVANFVVDMKNASATKSRLIPLILGNQVNCFCVKVFNAPYSQSVF